MIQLAEKAALYVMLEADCRELRRAIREDSLEEEWEEWMKQAGLSKNWRWDLQKKEDRIFQDVLQPLVQEEIPLESLLQEIHRFKTGDYSQEPLSDSNATDTLSFETETWLMSQFEQEEEILEKWIQEIGQDANYAPQPMAELAKSQDRQLAFLFAFAQKGKDAKDFREVQARS